MLAFLGLPADAAPAAPAAVPASGSYAALHARSLNASRAHPMLPATRRLLRDFFEPYNAALAALLRAPEMHWGESTVVDAKGIAAAGSKGAHFD